MPIAICKGNVGHDIKLTASGHRQTTHCTPNTSNTMDDSIPSQYRQAMYDEENGCVWLSACLLINSVDSKLAIAMIERYANDQKKLEWLDVFHRKKGQGKKLIC